MSAMTHRTADIVCYTLAGLSGALVLMGFIVQIVRSF